MVHAREGQSFIKHEFDEAIVIQQAIVQAERDLSKEHPLPAAKEAMGAMLRRDEEQLRKLESVGKRFGAQGKEKDDVSTGMDELVQKTAQTAKGGPDSEKYELHAVLLTLKRKQQDASDAIVQVAREMGDEEMKQAAMEMHKETQASADELSKLLGKLAVDLAQRGEMAKH
jgi:hypothetical protein